MSDRDASTKTLYVSNIPYKATSEDVAKFFSAYGRVVRTELAFDPASGHPKGYGFVDMFEEDADKAILADGERMDGRRLCVRFALTGKLRRKNLKPQGGHQDAASNAGR